MRTTYPQPPKPDQIDKSCPFDLSHPILRTAVFGFLPFLDSSPNIRDWLPGSQGTYSPINTPDLVINPSSGSAGRGMQQQRSLYTSRDERQAVAVTKPFHRPCTVSIWYKPIWFQPATGFRQYTVGFYTSDACFFCHGHGYRYDYNHTIVMAGSYGRTQSVGIAATEDKWQLLTMRIPDGRHMDFFIDGLCVYNWTTDANLPTTDFANIFWNWSGPWGEGAYVAYGPMLCHNRVLSDAEVFSLWNPATRFAHLRTLTGRRTFYVPAAGPAGPFRWPWQQRRSRRMRVA